MPLTAAACLRHPARPGIGICPSCATPVCEECATRVEGILRCRRCLGAAPEAVRRGWRSAGAVLPGLIALPLATAALAWSLYGLGLGIVLIGHLLKGTR